MFMSKFFSETANCVTLWKKWKSLVIPHVSRAHHHCMCLHFKVFSTSNLVKVHAYSKLIVIAMSFGLEVISNSINQFFFLQCNTAMEVLCRFALQYVKQVIYASISVLYVASCKQTHPVLLSFLSVSRVWFWNLNHHCNRFKRSMKSKSRSKN